MGRFCGVILARSGALLGIFWSKSADPDFDVEALLPCFAIMSRADVTIDAVVLMLKVLCESPPVPTTSH